MSPTTNKDRGWLPRKCGLALRRAFQVLYSPSHLVLSIGLSSHSNLPTAAIFFYISKSGRLSPRHVQQSCGTLRNFKSVFFCAMADTLCIYRRRTFKCLLPVSDDGDKENEKELNALLTSQESHVVKSSGGRKCQPSWIDRSLSSRSNISKVKADTSRRADDKAKQVMSPNVYRKKRVEAPEDFVREQRSYFDEVDAFELEEESPPSKDRWTQNLQQGGISDAYIPFNRKGLLQAVQEDTLEDLPTDVSICNLPLHKDHLSQILKTPRPFEGTGKSASKGRVQISKQRFGEKTQVSNEAHETPLTKKFSADAYTDPLRYESKICQSLESVQRSVLKQQIQILKQEFVETSGMKTRVSHEAHEKPSAIEIAEGVQTRNQSLSDLLAQRSMHGRGQVDLQKKTVYRGLLTPTEPIPTIIVSSDDEEEHPGKIFRPKRTSLKHLSQLPQDSEAASTRHYIILDSPISSNKECKTHSSVAAVTFEPQRISSAGKTNPENKNGGNISTERLDAGLLLESRTGVQAVQLHSKAEDGLLEGIENLKCQAIKDLDALLQKCGQKTPMRLEEAIGQCSNVKDVVKLGEGTYAEAFKASNLVFKIVPMGGSFCVNGEVQKTFAEMCTEMLVTLTLNRLRKQRSIELDFQRNVCSSFIESKMVKVCQGLYGQTLVNAWEEWDIRHESQNDHPKVFPENQVYMLFVLADGGQDLEIFPIASFDAARSILTQVIAALAIAEEDCEFEHRDLHWGNILVSQTELSELHCRLDGTDMQISTHGVFVHIIDFTLSRLSTGKEVLFSNLSDDPLLFKGPKGDIQAETYRKMLHLTKGSWDERFPKTNCYWIHYLVDVLLMKLKDLSSPQEGRALRAFKKRVVYYDSARDCLHDEFFALMKQ